MRLLHRNDDVHTDGERQHDVETTEHDEHTHRRHTFRNPFARDDTARDDTARDGTASRDAAVARDRHGSRAAARDAAARDGAVADRERADARRREVHEEEEVVETRKRVDLAGFLTAAYGAALAAIGALALVRTGVDDTWYQPVDQVARIDHSPLLGAIELGVGALVLLALAFGLRMFAALVALAAGVAAVVVAVEPSRVNPELAIERGWAIALAVVSLALGLLLIATRDRRRERRVVHRPVTV
jgi:hypothetical protein